MFVEVHAGYSPVGFLELLHFRVRSLTTPDIAEHHRTFSSTPLLYRIQSSQLQDRFKPRSSHTTVLKFCFTNTICSTAGALQQTKLSHHDHVRRSGHPTSEQWFAGYKPVSYTEDPKSIRHTSNRNPKGIRIYQESEEESGESEDDDLIQKLIAALENQTMDTSQLSTPALSSALNYSPGPCEARQAAPNAGQPSSRAPPRRWTTQNVTEIPTDLWIDVSRLAGEASRNECGKTVVMGNASVLQGREIDGDVGVVKIDGEAGALLDSSLPR